MFHQNLLAEKNARYCGCKWWGQDST